MSFKLRSPIFIVGMPRSGTKLLRDLLRQHPQICIPKVESHFIPFFIEKYGEKPNFIEDNNIDEFILDFKDSTFYYNLKEEGFNFNKEEFLKNTELSNWLSIFKYLLKNFGSDCNDEEVIWGDKSPEYMLNTRSLKRIFPDAKFIHIIRDPRDQALSSKKVWGKNLFRSAKRWKDSISKIKIDVNDFKMDYVEIKYEDLISMPDGVLISLCDFLKIDYVVQMVTLQGTTENYGNAKGLKKIMTHNKNNFFNSLNNSEIKRIEEITFPMLKSMGYDLHKAKQFRALSYFENKIYSIFDGLSLLNFHIKDKGLKNGLSYFRNINREIHNG